MRWTRSIQNIECLRPAASYCARVLGNLLLQGLVGGIPISSVIVRSTINIDAGAKTKLSAVFHGVLMLACVALLPSYLNMIPLSCLAAILLMTGLESLSARN